MPKGFVSFQHGWFVSRLAVGHDISNLCPHRGRITACCQSRSGTYLLQEGCQGTWFSFPLHGLKYPCDRQRRCPSRNWCCTSRYSLWWSVPERPDYAHLYLLLLRSVHRRRYRWCSGHDWSFWRCHSIWPELQSKRQQRWRCIDRFLSSLYGFGTMWFAIIDIRSSDI